MTRRYMVAQQSLEDRLQEAGGAVKLLRGSQSGPYVYPVVSTEYTNWRDEQRAWQKTCVLFNQSYHMSDMMLEGKDALKLLTDLGVNSMKNFAVDQAKQLVTCNHEGFVIGDVVLFYLAENQFSLVGRPPLLNWVQYHCETKGYNATVRRDERAAARQGPIERELYRYQVQGPNALKVMEKVTGAPVPNLKFFHMTTFSIEGCQVRGARHGMAGQVGFELFGPWDDRERVRDAIVEAGQEFGLLQAGSRAYSSNTLESGWIPSPLPAIYTGEGMEEYRRWLPANTYEGTASLGGSFASNDIEDYYLTPWDLGYGTFVKFDHDFVGREALERIGQQPRRKKVTLALDDDGVTRVFASMFGDNDRQKFMDLPSAVYSSHPYDKVMIGDKMVGVSTWCGYSSNERKMLTLAIIDVEHAAPGTPVTFVWGESNEGMSRPTVESHVETKIPAIVSPVPYAQVARSTYAEGWRTVEKV